MQYEVRCECGTAHRVSSADAGSRLKCTCGKTVEVPPLHELRAASGEAALSPVIRIRTMLLAGTLPGTQSCSCCRNKTDRIVRVAIECERSWTKSGVSKAEIISGCFLIPIISLLWTFVLLKSLSEKSK